MVGTVAGVFTPLAVLHVVEGNRSEPGSAITPSPSTMEKPANGLDQLMRRGLAILSTARVSARLETTGNNVLFLFDPFKITSLAH